MNFSQHSGQNDEGLEHSNVQVGHSSASNSNTTEKNRSPSKSTTNDGIFSGGPGLKLVVLIIMLVLVIWAMNQSGKPETWNWMFKNSPQPTNIDPPGQSDRLGQSGESNDASRAAAQVNTIDPSISSRSTNLGGNQAIPFTTPAADSVDGLELDFWNQALRKLDSREQVNLITLVRSAVNQEPIAKGETSVINNLLARLEKLRTAYDANLLAEASRRMDTERAFSESMIEFQRNWNTRVFPAMQAVINDQPNAAIVDATLQTLPEIVGQAASQLVHDRSNVGRSIESYAWFDAWSEVFDSPIDPELNHPVTVTQLLSQPNAYRGETVSIKGRALRVEKIPAGRNPLRIETYFVVWVKPDHASTYPYCVYSLMIPESLNSANKNQSSWTTDLPVESTARFFKIRLFDAGEAAFAPLLMSASVRVDSDSHVVARTRSWMPSRNWMLTMMVCIAVLAVAIAWAVYRATTRKRRNVGPGGEIVEHGLKLLKDDQRIETVSEKLKRMGTASEDTTQP